MRRVILLLAVLGLAVAGSVPQAGADEETHSVRGKVFGEFAVAPDAACPTGLRSSWDGVGQSSLTYLTSAAGTHCTPPTSSDPILGGEMSLVSASGKNTLELTYTGTSEPIEIVEGATILAHVDGIVVGGTGRFEEATGWLHITARIPYLHLKAPSLEVTTWNGEVKF